MFWEHYLDKSQKIFGKVDKDIMEAPVSMLMYMYNLHLLYHWEESLVEGLVALLPSQMIAPRLMDYLKSRPNYLDNALAKNLLARGPTPEDDVQTTAGFDRQTDRQCVRRPIHQDSKCLSKECFFRGSSL